MSRMIRRFEQLMSDARPGQFLAADGNNRPVWVDSPVGGIPQWNGSGWSSPPASAVAPQAPSLQGAFFSPDLSNGIFTASASSMDIQVDTNSNDFPGVIALPFHPANGTVYRITDVSGHSDVRNIAIHAVGNGAAFNWNGTSVTTRIMNHRWESQTWMYSSWASCYLMIAHANTGVSG